jgi:hypothetical protein
MWTAKVRETCSGGGAAVYKPPKTCQRCYSLLTARAGDDNNNHNTNALLTYTAVMKQHVIACSGVRLLGVLALVILA